MDLGAYVQIDDLDTVMKENNIYVPRLRGLRLMAEQKPASLEEIQDAAKDIGLYACEEACESGFRYDPICFVLSRRTSRLKKKYLVYDGHTPIGIRWDRIHGKKRKLFKYEMKKANQRMTKSMVIFNKYCGMPDILYIHARIGGSNWPRYRSEVDTKPWFIEKVDDPFDSTYCDIYARIQPVSE